MPKKLTITITLLILATLTFAQTTNRGIVAETIAESESTLGKPEIKFQIGHTASVNSVSFSPDGKYLASGSDYDTIKLWDMESGKEVKTFSVYSIVDAISKLGTSINYTKRIGFYNYSETEGFVVLYLPLLNGSSLLVKSCRDKSYVTVLDVRFNIYKYPIGSGVLYNNLLSLHGLDENLNMNTLYLMCYSEDLKTLYFVDIYSLPSLDVKTVVNTSASILS